MCLQKKFVYKDRIKMLPIIQNSLTNDQNGRTAQKLLRGYKRQTLLRNAENCLEVIFVTKTKTKFFWKKTNV